MLRCYGYALSVTHTNYKKGAVHRASKMAQAALQTHELGDRSLSTEDLRELKIWKEMATNTPLRVMVCGLGGAGKSTLINTLLHLEGDDEQLAEAGKRAKATTLVVSKHEKTTKSGIKVCFFDTPGLGDPDLDDDEIVARMEKETEKKLDIVFYCLSLAGSARVQGGDVKAMKLLTQAFGSRIWKKTVIVLTFSNYLERDMANKEQYDGVIKNITETIRNVLENKAYVKSSSYFQSCSYSHSWIQEPSAQI
jgi:predicted GTPase